MAGGCVMSSVVIVDVRALTALGDLEATWDGLMESRSALKPLDSLEEPFRKWQAGHVPHLNADFGGTDRLNALLDRLLSDLEVSLDTHLIAATTKGAPDEFLHHPAGPWQGQPWDLSELICKKLALSCSAVTVSAACASGTMAVIQGTLRLQRNESKAVLVVGIDILSRFVLSGFAGLKALSPGLCRPFDQDRNGLCLGEGAGLALLMTEEEAVDRGLRPLARISGCGSACDASHITAPCRQATGLIAAIRQATQNGRLRVGAVHAHGTGTLHNDAMEMTAFSSCWENQVPPFHSVKGAIGHTLGAAGVIETAIAIKSLQSGFVPPTVGLVSPEVRCKEALTGSSPQPLVCPSILKCNSGFGGINAALLLEAFE